MVIAHEISHVLKRHQTKELQATLVDSVDTVNGIKKLISNSSSNADWGALFRPLILADQMTDFSQQQEHQADACGVRIIARHDKKSAKRMINRYAKVFGNSQSEKGDDAWGQVCDDAWGQVCDLCFTRHLITEIHAYAWT